jgi:acyl dehydratase
MTAGQEVVTVRGRWFDEFKVGQKYVTPSRTITETDIVNFASLSGDFNYPHSNHEYIKTSQFSGPIAHGPLVYSIAGGLLYASGLTQETVVALLQIDGWRMLHPTMAGDTIRLESTVLETRPTSDGKRGVVTFQREIVNQDDVVAQEMTARLLFRRDPALLGS